jgi:hypothetical protein
MVEAASLHRLVDGHKIAFASTLERGQAKSRPLPMGAEFDQMLPDGGLPRSSVIELSAPNGLGTLTRFALTACERAQWEARLRCGESAWCAWLDPDQTLYAPAVRAHGVDLERLLIVRAPRPSMFRVAVQLAQARVFSVLVIDASSIPGTATSFGLFPRTESVSIWVRATRRLALEVEASRTIVLLLTDADAPRPQILPAAMRLELSRDAEPASILRVAKERYGRVGGAHRIDWTHRSGSNDGCTHDRAWSDVSA